MATKFAHPTNESIRELGRLSRPAAAEIHKPYFWSELYALALQPSACSVSLLYDEGLKRFVTIGNFSLEHAHVEEVPNKALG
jgi:hypothetical protein